MTARNAHWYILNSQRAYPIDDSASRLDDNGSLFQSSHIVDLSLRWGSELGEYAYVSAYSVTPGIVTTLIEVADDLDNPTKRTLVAGISLPLSTLQPNRVYTLVSYHASAAGFIAFGDQPEPCRHLFSSPRQSFLSLSAARSVYSSKVTSFSLEGSGQPLTGLIELAIESPLSVTKETREINGETHDNVLVFRLQDDGLQPGDTSVFEEFAGACAKRVSSRNCGDPQPILTINNVTPDCDGQITLDFRGCATIARVSDTCDIVIDCNYGLSRTCDPLYLPDLETGKLPFERDAAVIPPYVPPQDSESMSDSISESVVTSIAFPYCDTFDTGDANFFTGIGPAMFTMVADDSPDDSDCCIGAETTYGCGMSQSVSDSMIAIDPVISYGVISSDARTVRHIGLFTGDVQCLYRRLKSTFRLYSGQPGTRDVGGLIHNYRIQSSGLPSYFTAMADVFTKTFGIFRFDGISYVPVVSASAPNLEMNTWYDISFLVKPANPPTNVSMTATLETNGGGSVDVEITTTVSSNLWVEDTGQYGVLLDKSTGCFSHWRVEISS